MKIINQTRGCVIASRARMAQGFWARAKGLLGKKELLSGEALVIPHCQAIHMFFMRFAIDAVFLNKGHSVEGVICGIRPFRLSPFFPKAWCVIELPEGTIRSTGTQEGDHIFIQNQSAQ